MQTKTDVSKYVVNVQGKDFITFPGLLQEAHAKGLKSINTDLVNEDLNSPVVKATVTLVDNGLEKSFTGYGDATSTNVAKKVAGALLRMAETRAIARALRFACNIDMAAVEELDAEENVINNKPAIQQNRPNTAMNRPVQTTPVSTPKPAPTYQSRPTSQVVRPFQRPTQTNQVIQKTASTPAPVTEDNSTVPGNVEDVEF